MRRNLTILILLASATLFSSACGGSSNTSNADRVDTDMTVNSERVESSNIAPTGGPGPEPESRGTQSSENTNANASNTDNKNKSETKNKNTQ